MDTKIVYAYSSSAISNDFIWEVADYGYDITRHPFRFDKDNNVDEALCIVPALHKKKNGMRHKPYFPLRNVSQGVLFEVFARLWTENFVLFQENLIKFVNKYGPLTELTWEMPGEITNFPRRDKEHWGYYRFDSLTDFELYDFMLHKSRVIISRFSHVVLLQEEAQRLSIMLEFWNAILHRNEGQLLDFLRPKEEKQFPYPGLSLFGLNSSYTLTSIWKETGGVWKNGKPSKMPARLVDIARGIFTFLLDRHMKSFPMTLTRVLEKDGKTGSVRVLPSDLLGAIWYQFFQYVCEEKYADGILVQCIRGDSCLQKNHWGIFTKENHSGWVEIKREKYKGLFCHDDCYASWDKSVRRAEDERRKKTRNKKNTQRREQRTKGA